MPNRLPLCERCDAPLPHGYFLGWFNRQALCATCYHLEQTHPEYDRAVSRWQAAYDAGRLDFSGIGLPVTLQIEADARRARPTALLPNG